jgi:hypothetical protein
LLTLVDDATGHTLGRLGAQETIWAAVAVLRHWIEQHGVPHALYTDWKNVYVRPPNVEEQATGAVPLTQFGRMCAALDLRIIAASSPQAKGRVERNHGTHQDRLVKKLRRLGITDPATANTFLAQTYLPEHNARFAQVPASAEDFHRRAPGGATLDAVFQLEETRVLSNDWVVQYDARYFQLVRQSRQAPARSTVLVRENVAGMIEIRYRGRRLQWTELAGPPPKATRPPTPPVTPARPPEPTECRSSLAARLRGAARAPRGPREEQNEQAYGRCRSRGRTDRAHRSLENSQNEFSTAPTGPSYLKGDISISLRMGTFLFRVDRTATPAPPCIAYCLLAIAYWIG